MKHVHFIGIAGSAIAPIALMMKKMGWKVTGSEHNQVWEPMKSFLKDNGLKYVEQDVDLESVRAADMVVIGGSVLMTDQNHPEFVEAKKLKKKLVGYGEVLREFVVKKNSVVVCGSYGKTTISALLAWILDVAGLNPSFMSGGKQRMFESGVRRTDSDYSVLEGDEYAAVWGFDMEPRFIYYKPKYTLLTSAMWDHKNIYPTEKSYIDAFKKLARETEKTGGVMLICASGENNKKIADVFDRKIYTYMLEGSEQKVPGDINFTGKITGSPDGRVRFTISEDGKDLGDFETSLIGSHNVENCLAAVAMARILEIDVKKIKKAVASFENVARRLEFKGKTKTGAAVIDDFGHSPVKVAATLKGLREQYQDKKIIAVYDPHHILSFPKESLKDLEGVFDPANVAIIPQVRVKKSTPKDERIYGSDIIEAIRKTQPNAEYIPINDNIVKYIEENSDKNTIVVFLSSVGWKGIIEKLIKDSKN